MKLLKIVLAVVVVLAIAAYVAIKKLKVNPPIKALSEQYDSDLPLDKLKLKPGFSIEPYATNIVNARSMCFGSSDRHLFVGTRSEGSVYAMVDEDGDYKSDKTYTIYEGGNMPNGVAFRNGNLYIAEVNRVLVFEDIESNLNAPGEPKVLYDEYPDKSHHGWKYIAFGPDGWLYIPVGAPCNICESEDEIFNTITRLNVETLEREILHKGIRNTVGFDWNPLNDELWFTDNGRDMLGDNMPECELNHAPQPNMHFGYPYCHQGDIADPKFGDKRSCDEFTPPAAKLGPHTAPLGMEFYSKSSFPSTYQNSIFVARHGSWNRSEKIGYDLVSVFLDENGKVSKTEVFIEGWLSEDKKDVWGRPVDVEMCSDGSMLVSDDFADAIYRVSYQKP